MKLNAIFSQSKFKTLNTFFFLFIHTPGFILVRYINDTLHFIKTDGSVYVSLQFTGLSKP